MGNPYLGALLRGWWMVPLVLAASAGSAAFLTARQEAVYRSSATFVVTPTYAVEGGGDILRSLDTLERRSVIATFARIPPTPEARVEAARRLGSELAPLAPYRIAASVLPSTNIIKIDVDGPDPRTCAALANAVGGATRARARRLYRIFTLKTLAEARPPDSPVFPNPQRNLVVAGVLGALLGLAAAIAVGSLRREASPRAARATAGVPAE